MIRLIDLNTDWLLQYVAETTVFDPALYAWVPGRLAQLEGYLQGTWAAVVSCSREGADWARHADPWAALGELLARVEAEFCGRLLFDADDLDRWRDDPEGLCWGMLGVSGFDALVRTPADLDRLPRLFERGVRLFRPVSSASNALGGSSAPDDDRGLTDLGRAFLQSLADLPGGPSPLLDLAHLGPLALNEALDWFEADARRVIPVHRGGALGPDDLRRVRALGGVIGLGIGPPFITSPDQLRAAIEIAASVPFEGRAGVEGIAIATGFPGLAGPIPGLGHVAEIVAWLTSTFDPAIAAALIHGNARNLFERALRGKLPQAHTGTTPV